MENNDRSSPNRPARELKDEASSSPTRRWWRAWATPFLSMVVIMGLLIAAQSHLTAYEEKRARELRKQEDQSYAALRKEEGNGLHLVTRAVVSSSFGNENEYTEYNDQGPADIIRDLIELSRVSKSPRGRQYRSLICALSRNDVHLREYIVRNLLAGFAHVVIYDNNQVGKDMDHDIRKMVSPFVDAGLVTHVPWDQNSSATHLDNDRKNTNSRQCLEEFGSRADWVSIMDTDEVFYVHKKGKGALGTLNDYLDELESKSPKACATSFPWRMMYGEKRVLKPPGLLMDAHHKVCKIHDATKMLFRPDWSEPYNIPHFLHCTNEGGVQYRTDEGDLKDVLLGGQYDLHLLHYYAKSVEEWMTKLEQSIPPYIRYLPDAYDHVRQCLEDFAITYDADYEKAVRGIMRRFWAVDEPGVGDGGIYLGPAPEFAPGGQLENYDMYIFFKLRVAMRDEWDEGAYLQMHGDVTDAVGRRLFVDGLQHFMEDGFKQGRRSCWVREGRKKVCV